MVEGWVVFSSPTFSSEAIAPEVDGPDVKAIGAEAEDKAVGLSSETIGWAGHACSFSLPPCMNAMMMKLKYSKNGTTAHVRK